MRRGKYSREIDAYAFYKIFFNIQLISVKKKEKLPTL